MTYPEHSVLAAIAELEAEEQDDITELVRWQLEKGVERGEALPQWHGPRFIGPAQYALYRSLMANLPQWDIPDDPLGSW
ncbi:hypothetical protein [Nocardia fusca]|uniref:Uncharacterized protein n=1 Tax=Nocardia fusca TaxID=941183 RepID=A0ABV3FIN3_9NOCA